MSADDQLSIAAVTRAIAERLSAVGIDDARLDARILLAAATGLSRERLLLEEGRALTPDEARRLDALVRRRLAREPVTRILGERHFYGRRFEVTPDTLDPRPDTETLVDLALEIARDEGWLGSPIEIADIGTGTGCILLTLLAELPRARGIGIDISGAAIEVAKRNAATLGVEHRVTWRLARTLDGLEGAPHLIVSNPPYIPSGDIPRLDPEVRCFDPSQALDGGKDGFAVLREIVAASTAWPNGTSPWFAVEIGAGQENGLIDLIFKDCGPAARSTVRLRNDLGGHARCVAWKTHP